MIGRDHDQFVKLMLEYQSVARWVRAQAETERVQILAKLQAEVDELRKRSESVELESEAFVSAEHAKQSERQLVRDMLLGDVFAAFDLDADGFVDAKELFQLGAAREALKQREAVWSKKNAVAARKKVRIAREAQALMEMSPKSVRLALLFSSYALLHILSFARFLC